jgi:hypothetical protein
LDHIAIRELLSSKFLFKKLIYFKITQIREIVVEGAKLPSVPFLDGGLLRN